MAAPAVGDILVRTASGWKRLPPGTFGYALVSGGAGAIPSWAAPAAGSGGLPYMYPYGQAIDDSVNDNFRVGDGAGGMDTAGTRFSGATAWTAENIGASVVAVATNRLWLTAPSSASLQIRGYYQAVPSGNWCIRSHCTLRGGTTEQRKVGMYLRENATGKIETWGIGYSGGGPLYWAGKWTNATTYSATRATATVAAVSFLTSFLEIEYDGTNYYFRHGYSDGASHIVTVSGFVFAKANFFTTAADGIGLFAMNDSSVATTLADAGFYRVPVSNVL